MWVCLLTVAEHIYLHKKQDHMRSSNFPLWLCLWLRSMNFCPNSLLWSLSLSKPSGWTFLSNVRLWSESNLEVCFFDFICTITYVLVNCKSNYALPHSLKTLRICCVCVCVILTRYWIAQWNISKVKICYFLMHIWNSLTGYNWYINWR